MFDRGTILSLVRRRRAKPKLKCFLLISIEKISQRSENSSGTHFWVSTLQLRTFGVDLFF